MTKASPARIEKRKRKAALKEGRPTPYQARRMLAAWAQAGGGQAGYEAAMRVKYDVAPQMIKGIAK